MALNRDPQEIGVGQPTDFNMFSINAGSLDLEEQPPEAADIRDDFQSLINNLAESLSPKNLEQLRYYYRTKLGAHEGEQMSALAILAKLEEKGVYSQNNISPLEKMMKKVERCDLITNLIEPFKERHKENWLQGASHNTCSPHHRSSQPTCTSPSFNSRRSFQHHSYTSLMSQPSVCSLASIPENSQVNETSLLVCGRYTRSLSVSQNESYAKVESEGSRLTASLTEQPHTQSFPQQHQTGNRPAWPSSTQQIPATVANSSRSVHTETPFGAEKYSQSVESTQFQLENPPAEVRSKFGATTNTSLTASIREQQEQHRSLTPLPLKSPQLTEEDSEELNSNSFVLVPNNRTFNSMYHPVPGKGDHAGTVVTMTTRGDQPTTGAAVNGGHEKSTNYDKQCTAVHVTPQECKWHTKRPHIFKVNRKKICNAISSLSVSQCAKLSELVIPVGCPRAHGLKIILRLHPFGCDLNDKYLTVKAQCIFEPKHPKCRDLLENYKCVAEVNIVACELPSGKEIGRADNNRLVLTSKSNENVLTIKLVKHCEVIYKRNDVKNIQLEVTAMLRCVELVQVKGEEDGFSLVHVVSTGS